MFKQRNHTLLYRLFPALLQLHMRIGPVQYSQETFCPSPFQYPEFFRWYAFALVFIASGSISIGLSKTLGKQKRTLCGMFESSLNLSVPFFFRLIGVLHVAFWEKLSLECTRQFIDNILASSAWYLW